MRTWFWWYWCHMMAIYIHIYLYDDIVLMTYIVPWLWICIDGATRWLMIWYTYIYMMSRWHEKMVLWWWLRSTTGPYGRPMLEVAYREILLSLHRGCTGDDSLRRVVGVSAWCIVHVWHTRVNTSVGSVYIIFCFLRYKNLCIYIYIIFKIYM